MTTVDENAAPATNSMATAPAGKAAPLVEPKWLNALASVIVREEADGLSERIGDFRKGDAIHAIEVVDPAQMLDEWVQVWTSGAVRSPWDGPPDSADGRPVSGWV